MPLVKRMLLRPLELPGVAELLARLTGTRATVFMLHRFDDPEHGIAGHSPEILRSILGYLRRHRYNLIPLAELFRRLRDGEPVERSVAFTIDDGYFDHARMGAPVFAEFDCPATIFAVTGFLDGQIWLWWDQLTWIFTRTARTEVSVRLGDKCEVFRLETPQARRDAAWQMNLFCQDAADADRVACIADLSRAADVELPVAPPPQFAPLTWDEARQLEKRGITFGPHTVTHPVLANTPSERAEAEIVDSWNRLRAEVANPVPVFCYPNGRLRDFGQREMDTVIRTGLLGGVSGHSEPLRPEAFRRPPQICRVPRFGFQDDLLDVLQCVSGVATMKSRFRGPAQ